MVYKHLTAERCARLVSKKVEKNSIEIDRLFYSRSKSMRLAKKQSAEVLLFV